MTEAPCARAWSTRRPRNDPIRTFERSLTASSKRRTRSSTLNNGVLEGFSTTPTITESNSCAARPTTQVDGHIGGPDGPSLGQVGPLEVGTDGIGRLPGGIHEGAGHGAARKRLDPDGTRPREQVQASSVRHVGAEARE